MKLEIVAVPVSDVDRTKCFYETAAEPHGHYEEQTGRLDQAKQGESS